MGKTFAEKHELKMTKTKEKLKLHLADGTVRVSQWVVQQGCVVMGEHAEFLDFFKLIYLNMMQFWAKHG